MASNDQADDVATYAASVRAALSNLPTDQSEVLLEDLEDHLREVAAEAEGPLAERLGPPEQYAQELRSAYGAAHAGGRRPITRIKPRGRSSDSAMRRKRVVLPTPFAPTRATRSPSGTLNETLSKSVRPPGKA